MTRAATIGKNEFVDAHLLSKPTQRVALYELRACVREKSLALAREMFEYDVTDDGIEDGVAQEFQPLIVNWFPLFVTSCNALVKQCCLVIVNLSRIESYDFV